MIKQFLVGFKQRFSPIFSWFKKPATLPPRPRSYSKKAWSYLGRGVQTAATTLMLFLLRGRWQ